MKPTLPIVTAVYLGLCAAGSAFTLDFVGLVGTQILPTNTLSITVAGYGTVEFTAALSSTLVIDSAHMKPNGSGAPSLSFDTDEAVSIKFIGFEPLDVDFDFVGVSPGEYFTVQADPFVSQAYLVTLQGSPPSGGSGAGIYQVSWNAVPEPSSALLGAVGAVMLAIRRRR